MLHPNPTSDRTSFLFSASLAQLQPPRSCVALSSPRDVFYLLLRGNFHYSKNDSTAYSQSRQFSTWRCPTKKGISNPTSNSPWACVLISRRLQPLIWFTVRSRTYWIQPCTIILNSFSFKSSRHNWGIHFNLNGYPGLRNGKIEISEGWCGFQTCRCGYQMENVVPFEEA